MSRSTTFVIPGRYVQEEFAVTKVGEIAKPLGKKALILGGERALSVALDGLKKSLEEAGITYEVVTFRGLCTPAQIDAHSETFNACGADFIIGVGGGRAIDTAKGVSYTTNKPVICVPTSVATCASYANIIILYGEDGGQLPYIYSMTLPIYAVVVDTDIIARKCPVRYFSSGMADSMAKYAEITYLMEAEPNHEDIFLAGYSYQMAVNSWKLNMKNGVKAFEDVKNGKLTPEVNDAISVCIMLTGVSSVWGQDVRQIAFAHYLCYALSIYSPQHHHDYLHGEMVSLGLPVQLMLNRAPKAELDELINFLEGIQAPVRPADIQLAPNEELLQNIFQYCYQKMQFMSDEDKKLLESSVRSFWA